LTTVDPMIYQLSVVAQPKFPAEATWKQWKSQFPY